MSKIFPFTRQEWLILSTTALGVFMSTLDGSIVNIALPSITSHFQAPLSSVEWVVMVYLLITSSLLLTYGRIGDMYGHKPIYVLGFAVFTVASVFIVMATTITQLIIFRGMQAIGGGMVVAVVQAIVAATFKPDKRGRAIGLTSMSVSLGLATGPFLGGYLTSFFGWQSIFVINIPIGIFGCLWAWRVLPHYHGERQRFDIPGTITLFISLMTLLLALSHGQDWGWSTPLVLGLLISFAAFFAFFIYNELHQEYPMIRMELFKNRLFAASNAAALFNYLTQYAVVFLMPFYLESILLYPSSRAGLVMAAFPAVMMLASPLSGILSDRFNARVLSSLGMGITALGVFLLSNIHRVQSLPMIIAGLSLIGLGTALFLTPNNTAIMSSVPRDQIGIASGMISTMRTVGQVLGIAICGAVFSNRMAYYSAHLPAELYQQKGFVLAQHDAFLLAILAALIGMTVSLVRGPQNSLGKKADTE